MNSTNRIEELRIGDIMIPMADYPCISPQSTIHEAIEILETSQLEVDGRSSLPRVLLVCDLPGHIAGTVRRRDIIRGLEPKHLLTRPLNYRKKLFDVGIDPNLSEMSHNRLVKGIREQAEKEVSTIMRPIQLALDYDDHIIKGFYEMVSYGVTLLPVLLNSKVVGVVRSVELFREMAHIVLAPDPQAED